MQPLETVEEHNDRMNREAERGFNARLGHGRATHQEVIVREETRAPALPAGVNHPMEVEPAQFRRSLERRSENRGTLVQWIKDALKPGVDYGKIHYVKKSTCGRGAACPNPEHFTKDVLFKTGAEKICGMLGVTPTFPNLARYEEAALAGAPISAIILRCHILAAGGQVVSEGVGARSLAQDYGDLNKSLKMASKSALLEAALRMAGLSEIFSHPDSPPPKAGTEESDFSRVPCGRFEGQYWADLTQKYLHGVIGSDKAPATLKEGAQAELARRPRTPEDFDDQIPD